MSKLKITTNYFRFLFWGYNNNKETILIIINKILDAKPDYSLAKLLRQVFDAEWSPSELRKMAEHLHPKVVDTIYEIDNGDSNDD